MKKFTLAFAVILLGVFSLAGCQSQDVGMVTGAVAGGAIGAGLSNSNPAATIGGAVVGGYVGRQVAR